MYRPLCITKPEGEPPAEGQGISHANARGDVPTAHSGSLWAEPEPTGCALKKTKTPLLLVPSFQKQPLGRSDE